MNTSHSNRIIAALFAVSIAYGGSVRADNDKHRGKSADNGNIQTPQTHRSANPLSQRLYDDRSQYSGYNRRANSRPVNDVIREVQHRYGGQVIGVQQSESGMYRVRILQRDGRVKNVLVPSN